MSRLAYVCIGAGGHVRPSLRTMRELSARGHDVVYLVPEGFRELVESGGSGWRGYRSTLLAVPPRRVDGFDGGDLPLHLATEIDCALPQLERELADLEPELVLVDAFTHAGWLAALELGLPTLRVDTSYVLSDEYDYFDDVAAGRVPGRISTEAAVEELECTLRRLADCRSWTAPSFAELRRWQGVGCLCFVTRAMHPHSDRFGERVCFVGAGFDPDGIEDRRCEAAGMLRARKRERPLVYVSFGTVFTYQPAVYEMCLEVFGRREVDLVVATGVGSQELGWLDIPDNAQVVSFAPQPELLRHADLFISHGGMGAVMESTWFGVPTIFVPQYPEQWISAGRCEELGIGVRIDRRQLSIASLDGAAERLLGNPRVEAACRLQARCARAEGGYRRAADYVERFMGGGLRRS